MNHPRFAMARAASVAAAALLLASLSSAPAQLLEYDDFSYTGTALNGLGGGTGWAGNNWADPDADAPLSGDATSLTFPALVSFTPSGARLSFQISGEAERRLGTPMPLNVEGTNFYVSALVKRQGDFRIEFMDNSNNVRWRLGANGASGVASNAVVGVANDVTVANVFPTDETVFMVARIRTRSSSSANDEVAMNVYRSGQIVPADEPTVWQATGGSASGVSLTRLQVRNISDLPLEVDEIRVGTTYASVAGPLLSGPPIITKQPAAQTVYQGVDVQFSVEVVGGLPFTYQWKKDGGDIAGATSATLLLANVQPSSAASYSVQVTNPSGTTNSAGAALSIIPVTDIGLAMEAFWHFDETSGLTAADATTNHNDGSLINFAGDDTQWVPSYYTRALAFNGANYVEVPHSDSVGTRLLNNFTVAAWFKSNVALSTNGNAYRMLEKENSFFLLQGDGGGLSSGGMNLLVKKSAANISVGIGEALQANRWYHIAGTFDGTTLRIYLDGTLKGTRAVAAPIDGSDLPLHIGSDYTAGMTGAKYLNGAIDEVGLWSRPLMASEIAQLAGRSGPPNLIEQPQAQSPYVGGTAVFRVASRGQEPLRYLWYKGTNEIRSANGPTLTLADVQPGDAGEYRCKVSNDLEEKFSNTAMLTVTPVAGVNTAMEALWKLDETTGLTAADSSGRSRTGTLVSFTDPGEWGAGQVGGSLTFDGADDHVTIDGTTPLTLGLDATFAFWVRPDTYGTLDPSPGNYTLNHGRILRKGTFLDIYGIDDPGSVRATLRANGVNAQQHCLQLGVWQHFVVSMKGGMVTFYKDGFQLGDPVPGGLGATNADTLTLGSFTADLSGTTSMFAGKMDEVGIWNRALSETEILTLAGRDAAGGPVIVNAPQSAARYAGGSVSFLVDASGKRPLTYVWKKDGTPLSDSNTNRLALANLTLADAGAYTVTVQNDAGVPVTSAQALLTVQAITNVTTGLVAYWPFNETSGSVLNDASGRGHNGVLNNFEATPGNVGVIGGAFSFDGVDDFIVVPHAPDLNFADQASISVWVSPASLGASTAGGLGRILRKDINLDLTLYSGTGTLRMYGLNKVIYDAPANSVITNQWQHLAVVLKDGTVEFFKNGRSLAAPQPGFLGPIVTNDLIIANFGPDLSIVRLYSGFMDELGVWNRALDPAEIDGIYQNGLLGRPLNAAFEPLQIRNLNFTSASQARLLFFSPYVGRQHAIQARSDLGQGSWAQQAGVTFTSLGNGLMAADFTVQPSNNFYRVALLPEPAIFFQDFETSIQGWTHGGAGDNWEWGTPVNGPRQAYSGTKVFATSLTGNIEPYSDNYLRSPAISLAGHARATLSFQEWRNVDPDPTFHGTVVNVLDAATLQVVQQLSVAAGGTTGYELRSIPLPAQVMGRSIVLEFKLYCDNSNLLEGWYIDDVTITPE